MPRSLKRGIAKSLKSYLGEKKPKLALMKKSDLSLSCAVSRREKVHHYRISELKLE